MGGFMQAIQRLDQGIELRYDDSQWSLPEGSRTRMRPAVSAGNDHAIEDDGASRSDWIAHRVLEAGVARSATTLPLERTPAARTHALEATTAPLLRVPLGADENAVLLLEADGVLSWQFPDAVETGGAATRALRSDATREARFTVAEPLRAATAGSVDGWIIARLKVTILKFIARKVAGGLVATLESGRREGPVVVNDARDPSRWELSSAYPFIAANAARPARILLLVHGTFSTVRSSFGHLCATSSGQGLLEGALASYDAVWGWDHRTLSTDPGVNAQKLCAALAAITHARPPVIDIVCHSRGALVVRSLVETLLPAERWRPQVRRIVFVAGTNAGTQLARPANWHALIDLFTNLVVAGQLVLSRLGAPAVARAAAEVMDGVADFVGYLVEAGIEGGAAAGLAALDPDGAFVREINRVTASEPAPASCEYYAIESDFEPRIVDAATHFPAEFPRRLALMIANGLVDRLMQGGANDLVVDVASVTSINPPAGRMQAVQDYGRNPVVYHTNYLLQDESVEAIARWLELPPPTARSPGPDAREGRPHAGAHAW
jgi:hypothetical protein